MWHYPRLVDPWHDTSDRQSLTLTQAAVDCLQAKPDSIAQVLQTLDHWDRISGPETLPLRIEWRRILVQRDWARALAADGFAQQLRQASPLGKALSPRQRWTIIKPCKGHSSST